jgi:hypothetical protein
VAVPGANAARLVIKCVDMNTLGGYTCRARNSAGSADSAVCHVQLAPEAPVIEWQPSRQCVWNGAEVTLKLVARGIPSVSYQWYFKGEAISEEDGGCEEELRIVGFSEADVGPYVCRVYNDAGAVMTRDIDIELMQEAKVRVFAARLHSRALVLALARCTAVSLPVLPSTHLLVVVRSFDSALCSWLPLACRRPRRWFISVARRT